MASDEQLVSNGVAFPVALDAAGRLATAAGAEKIRQSVMLILGTEPGERLMRPDYGCHLRSLVFEPNSLTTARIAEFQVREALTRWEPRIVVEAVVVKPVVVTSDNREYFALSVQVVYRVKATGGRDGVTFELPLS